MTVAPKAEYTIRLAATNDLLALLELRREAERWLHGRGIRQWTPDYRDHAREVLRNAIEQGHAHVVTDDRHQVVATISVWPRPDPNLWAFDYPASGFYLGKMIVSRALAGRHLGDAILNWAGDRAFEMGKQWVRLDCRRDNKRLHQYYLDRGFEAVGVVYPQRHTETGWRGQRKAGLHWNWEGAPTLVDITRNPTPTHG